MPIAVQVWDVLGTHVWGFASSVAFPMLLAYAANVSSSLFLPPIDNVVMMNIFAEYYLHGKHDH